MIMGKFNVPPYFNSEQSMLTKTFLWYIWRLEKIHDINIPKNNYIKEVKNQRVLPPYKWRANNCILRYDDTLKDTGHAIIFNMFDELCKHRQIPDIEFFVNRRDFPIITNDGTECYYDLVGSKNKKLVSHNYDKYCPIVSMVTVK